MSSRLILAMPLLLIACASHAQDDPAASRKIPAFTVPLERPNVIYHRFIAFGDHGTGSKDQQRVADVMAMRAARDKVDFMLTLGDNFYGSGVDSTDDPQWKTKWENVYAAKSLQIPVYPTLGNHDHKGSVQAQIDYSKINPNWKLPARYYTFRLPLDGGEHAQFFALDTDVFGRADPDQLTWLKRELGASKARWKIVFGHHPLYSHSKRFHNLRMIRHLEPILRRFNVDLYVAGHDHVLEMLKPVHGVNYVVSGAGGGPGKAYSVRWTESSHYAATRGGFCLFRLSKTELVIEFVRMNGETQYAHTLHKGRLGPF